MYKGAKLLVTTTSQENDVPRGLSIVTEPTTASLPSERTQYPDKQESLQQGAPLTSQLCPLSGHLFKSEGCPSAFIVEPEETSISWATLCCLVIILSLYSQRTGKDIHLPTKKLPC